ncbi:DNA (cytosine-5-)-methyltransferase [Niallia circulans]|uniref:DNA (cytosine-5-)-methyltransferase n=1 Tax=Niallia circulans TaxID=1397 RepID=UPI00155FCCC7|nr:DNA (cytosine-5-)-methyltransferase [Niallia circulans]NRG30720.1 DNA (cytosine-5-)-methyltransferase [Niallia circulans]
MTFNYVSLFSGIGGFEQALNKLGGTCVMASEIDKYANQSYEILYGHPTVGDVTKIAAEDVPDHDLLVGGFPCQAFSVAGKRLGFEDTRGTLFFEIARIASTKQPSVLLLENVKGLISHDKGKTLDTIIQTLANIGYTVDFIEGSNVVAKGKRRISEIEGVKTFNFDWPAQEDVTTRLRDILEDNVDEKYYLSEEKTAKLVAQLEERTEGLAIKEATTKGYAVAAEGDAVNFQFPDSKTRRGRVGKQIAQTLEASGINQGVVEPQMLGHVDLKGHDAIRRVDSTTGVSPTLTTMGGGHREPKIAEEVRACLTPDRIEKRQNGRRFKDNDEEAFPITAQDRHGVAIEQFTQGDGVSCCVDASYAKGTAPGDVGKGRRTHVLESKYRIRKLTPRECFRLQGFPDSEFDKLVEGGISNSQLYKQAGNAVTVNVISAIGKRLITYLN